MTPVSSSFGRPSRIIPSCMWIFSKLPNEIAAKEAFSFIVCAKLIQCSSSYTAERVNISNAAHVRLHFGSDFLEIKFHIKTKISSQVFNTALLAPVLEALHVKPGCWLFWKTEGGSSEALIVATLSDSLHLLETCTPGPNSRYMKKVIYDVKSLHSNTYSKPQLHSFKELLIYWAQSSLSLLLYPL